MNTQSDPNRSSEGITPDALLHVGTEGPVTAEDIVLASGRDLNPKNLAWAEQKLATEGKAALDRLLP